MASGPSNQQARAPAPPVPAREPSTVAPVVDHMTAPINVGRRIRTEKERLGMESSFETGYCSLREKAEVLEAEIKALESVGRVGDDTVLSSLGEILDGNLTAAVSRYQPRPIRELVRQLSKDKAQSLKIIIEDSEEILSWMSWERPTATADDFRRRLVKRLSLLDAALPEHLEGLGTTALMHMEHEVVELEKKYANSETMLGDPVPSIPRKLFLATEDNYAWDMSELARGLELNGGVMRNPISKQMFSVDDIRKILAHPLGQRLQPLAVEQDQLKRGVREKTIGQLERLSAIIAADLAPDAAPSMQAIDEFMGYMAALPPAEQRALDVLSVPATDSHTGKAYDYTIGESVRDAKANRTCFHKTGDFLGQAAAFLRAL